MRKQTIKEAAGMSAQPKKPRGKSPNGPIVIFNDENEQVNVSICGNALSISGPLVDTTVHLSEHAAGYVKVMAEKISQDRNQPARIDGSDDKPAKKLKAFTIENLKKDDACREGIEFVAPIIERGEDVPTALREHNLDWLQWAIERGYDCESARSYGFTWDDKGHITATAGRCGCAAALDYGVATAEEYGTATTRFYGTSTAGDNGIALSNGQGSSFAGTFGIAISRDGGVAKAGRYGTAISGRVGTAEAGYMGTAMSGEHGTAKAGHCGIIQIKFHDGTRWRLKTGYIGEGGLKPSMMYKLDSEHEFIEVLEEKTQADEGDTEQMDEKHEEPVGQETTEREDKDRPAKLALSLAKGYLLGMEAKNMGLPLPNLKIIVGAIDSALEGDGEYKCAFTAEEPFDGEEN